MPSRPDQSASPDMLDFPSPAVLWVPMIQHDGPAGCMVVDVGREVERGELIGEAAEAGSLNVHAPLTGRIAGIGHVDTARAFDVPAIQLEPTESKGVDEGARETRVSSSTLPDELKDIELLADLADGAGLTDFGLPTVGLGDKLRRAASKGVRDIIINTIPAEPTLLVTKLLLAKYLDDIIKATQWLYSALDARRVWLAMDRSDARQVTGYRSATSGTPIRVVGLSNKYPQGSPTLLTKVVLGREIPYGQSPIDVGVLVLELEVLPALVSAVRRNEPMVDRIVTVGGPAAKRPGNYRICVGTRYADILGYVGLSHSVVRIIDGGLMKGASVKSLDAVVTKQTSSIMLLDQDTDRIPNPGPCIHCGWCQEDCPAGLDPMALLDVVERGCPSEAKSLFPHACIECGLCSYVCPAELPLTEAVVEIKQKVSLDV
ncbi:MAG: RnfABCDGE type electron transport complex subunit C [Planctomycetota bacterium]|nr:MAG: RnfABCDGE type electron transport complex subunit C [Planctomycetota bacterium]